MTIADTAVGTCKAFKRDEIVKGGWAILAVVYMEWVKMKECNPISDLPKVKKLEYWNMTPKDRPDSTRVMMVQAIYIYDLITNQFK